MAGQNGQLTPKHVLVADQCGNVGRVIARKLKKCSTAGGVGGDRGGGGVIIVEMTLSSGS